jgi:pyruvate formate lyase activating enzyme
VRENWSGELVASGYGQVSSVALDPIEKKPLYMFHPGKRVLSIGGFGCNLRCPFCQNYEISTVYAGKPGPGVRNSESMTPPEIAALAAQAAPDGNIGVAYTYNEPLIGYEFLYDCAELVHNAGFYNVVVTNGHINKEPLENLLPLIDAMNIDLKGFTDAFYEKLGGNLETVKNTIAISCKQCHVEVTTLVIPGENEDDIGGIAGWLSSIDPNIPLHLSRFFPRYRYAGKMPTPRETMYKLQETAKKYLEYVFIGNM